MGKRRAAAAAAGAVGRRRTGRALCSAGFDGPFVHAGKARYEPPGKLPHGEAGLIIAQLIVDGAPDPADNRLWGQFSFVALPRPGERIEVAHDGFMERLLIESVQHRPVPHPPPEKETLRGIGAQALVFARWIRK